MTDVQLIPIFSDNYVFVIPLADSKKVIIVDPGEAAPVLDWLQKRGLEAAAILLTHHHDDHIGGAEEMKNYFNCPVYAPLKNRNEIPMTTQFVKDGDRVQIAELEFEVIELPGHTLGHIAYYNQKHKWLFSGDVLFGLGCGRLFEGTFEQAYASLQKIKSLPAETQIFCAHEYTERNLQFALGLKSPSDDLDRYEKKVKSLRQQGTPTVPLRLREEMKANPFLLAHNLEEFKNLRESRNRF